MTAAEIRAQLRENGEALNRLTKDDPVDITEFAAVASASYMGEIAAQLAELNENLGSLLAPPMLVDRDGAIKHIFSPRSTEEKK